MREPLHTILIPKYPVKVKLSEKRLAKYYKKGTKKKIPKKYQEYVWNKQGILVHPVTGTKAIANPRSVGKPRYMTINGQQLYNGNMHHHTRVKVVDAIKAYYLKYLKDIKPITDLPIFMDWEIHTVIGQGNWDLDNQWIYSKCFQDALVEAGIIPDDNIRYITGAAAPLFVPCDSPESRALLFKIYSDDREEIRHNPYWEREESDSW